MKEFEAAIFDLGGTLVDDRSMIYQTFASLLKEFGKSTPTEKEFDKEFTSNWIEVFSKQGIEIDPAKTISKLEKLTMDSNKLKAIKVYGGTANALQRIKKKMKIAINTSYRKRELDMIMKIIKLPEFDAVATGDDLKRLKPDPRPIKEICKTLRVFPNECVMVGDTSADILCGKNAGTKTIAVTWGTNTERDLARLQPDLVAYSWGDITKFLGV